MPWDVYITGWRTALHHPVSYIILWSLLSSFREFSRREINLPETLTTRITRERAQFQ